MRIVGWILVYFNLFIHILKYISCKNTLLGFGNETCSLFDVNYGFLWFIGSNIFGIVGVILLIIVFYKNSNKYKNNNNKKDIIHNYENLKKLKELLDSKIITQEEFEKEKEKLLNK